MRSKIAATSSGVTSFASLPPFELVSMEAGFCTTPLLSRIRVVQKPETTEASSEGLLNCAEVVFAEGADEAAGLQHRLHAVNEGDIVHVTQPDRKR